MGLRQRGLFAMGAGTAEVARMRACGSGGCSRWGLIVPAAAQRWGRPRMRDCGPDGGDCRSCGSGGCSRWGLIVGLRQRGLFAMGAGTAEVARMRAGLRQRGLFAMGADRGPAAAGAVRDDPDGPLIVGLTAAGAVRDGGYRRRTQQRPARHDPHDVGPRSGLRQRGHIVGLRRGLFATGNPRWPSDRYPICAQRRIAMGRLIVETAAGAVRDGGYRRGGQDTELRQRGLFAMGAGTAEVARMRAGLRQRGLFPG